MAAVERIAKWYRATYLGVLALSVLGVGWVFVYGAAQQFAAQVTAVGVLAGLASAVLGVVLGFLFGIPRRTEGKAVREPGYAVNTNLEQVSDWLTKALLGIGLVELGRLITGFGNLSRALGSAMGGSSASAIVGGAIVAFFAPIGFLGGYIWARTTFMDALRDLDRIVRVSVADSLTDLDERVRVKARTVGSLQTALEAPEKGLRNREPVIDVPAPEVSQVFDLVTLWREIEDALFRIAGPVGGEVKGVNDLVAVLRRRGVVDEAIVDALNKLRAAAKELIGGAVLSEKDGRAVRASGAETLTALARLHGVERAAFEQHVLARLRAIGTAAEWNVDFDYRYLTRGGEPASVDAFVSDGSRAVAVEVRAQTSGRARHDELLDLLESLPDGLSLLLVLPDDTTNVRALIKEFRRPGTVKVLQWDTEADQFAAELQRLLAEN